MKVLRIARLGSNFTGSYKKSVTHSQVYFSYRCLGTILNEMKHNRVDAAQAECTQILFPDLAGPRLRRCCIDQFLGGAGFSTSVARRKTVVQLWSPGEGGVGGVRCKLSPVLSSVAGKFWLFCILNSSKQKEHIVRLVHE